MTDQLRRSLLAKGVTEDEVTELMNGYAHELAEKIRRGRWDWPNDFDEDGCVRPAYRRAWDDGMTRAADLIDPAVAP